MAKNQKSYTPEFKQQILVLYNSLGTSYPQLEREYSVNRSTISGWVKQFSPIRVSEGETVTLKEYKALQKKSNALRLRMKYYTKGGQIQKNYKALVCVPSNRQKEHETFGQEVKRAYEDSQQRYGL